MTLKKKILPLTGVALVLAAISIIGPPSAVALEHKRILIPWGNKRGQLSLVTGNKAKDMAFRGPSSLIFSQKKVYILDAVKPAIEVYFPNGKHSISVPLPKSDNNSKKPVYSDLAVAPNGIIFILESSAGIILMAKPDSSVTKKIPIPGREKATGYMTLSLNGKILSVFDCFAVKIVRLKIDGTPVTSLKSMLFQDLVADKQGNFYGATIHWGSKPSTKKLTVFKLDAVDRKKTLFATYTAAEEINNYVIAGTDNCNRVYVTVALGGADQTNEELMLIFDDKGTLTKSFRIPMLSSNMTMTRSKIVSDKGVIIISSPKKSGFHLLIVKRNVD